MPACLTKPHLDAAHQQQSGDSSRSPLAKNRSGGFVAGGTAESGSPSPRHPRETHASSTKPWPSRHSVTSAHRQHSQQCFYDAGFARSWSLSVVHRVDLQASAHQMAQRMVRVTYNFRAPKPMTLMFPEVPARTIARVARHVGIKATSNLCTHRGG
ncbi:hypothetical protein MRX96_042579 [Rhipicephalus microplus]